MIDYKKAEVELRGQALYFSARIETCLSTIIIITQADDLNDEGVILKMEFWKKVKEAKKRLKRKDFELYCNYEKTLNELSDLNFRHRMAHSEIDWREPTNFTVWEVVEKSKEASYVNVPYTVEEAMDEMQRLGDISDSMKMLLKDFLLKHTREVPKS